MATLDIPAVLTAVEAPVRIETKTGWKTSEFWVSVAVALTALAGALPIPPHYSGVVAAAIGGAYAISRGFAKSGVPGPGA